MLPVSRMPAELPSYHELSKRGRQRLSWIDFYFAHQKNASLTCRHFAISRDTLYRWLRRYDSTDLSTLNDRSRAPRTKRGRTTPAPTIDAVLGVRDTHPEWSKYKIGVILRARGIEISDSTVGRLLRSYGRIERSASVKRKRAASARFRRKRKPRELVASAPGDLVQIDTKHVSLPWGERRYHFVAIDIATRMKIAVVFKTGSSRSGARFLEIVLERFPFDVSAIQTDNGSEYAGEFHAACEERSIAHFFSHPRCPKQNAYVERAIRTDIDEFYLYSEVPTDIGDHNDLLAAWDRVYNEVRPHQSLGYLTPAAYHRRLTEQIASEDGS
jgi:transposase InsO family protein